MSTSPPRPWPGPRPGPSQVDPPAPGPVVEVADDQAAVAVDAAHLGVLARAVLVDHGLLRGELSLSFVDEDTMADLNGRYLGGDGPTDVLAFPLELPLDMPLELDADVEAAGAAGEMPVLLGDVAVCPEVADRNAVARSMSTDDELALLVVHGVLHVLGMDHAEPDEAAAMQSRERSLLAAHHHRHHHPRPFRAASAPDGTQLPAKGRDGG